MFIPFSKLTPDQAAYQSPGMQVVINALPATNSYRSFPNTKVSSDPLDSFATSGTYFKDDEGNTWNYAGTLDKLYRIEIDQTVTDISIAGGYNTEPTDVWNFIRWEQDLLATNFADPIQTLSVPDQTNFAVLASNAPKTRYLARIRDFLVAFNTEDPVDGVRPTRVWNSALNDITSWSASVVTQANFVDLDTSDGDGMGIVGGEYGVLFQERAITRMTYIGSPEVFQYDVIERGRGTKYPNSIVQFGNYVAYLGTDGFYVFDGQESSPIGDGDVNITILKDLDIAYPNKVFGQLDPVHKYIFWIYPSVNNPLENGTPNKIVCYNFEANTDKKWMIGNLNAQTLVQSSSPGYTLDNMDGVMPNIDVPPDQPSFDSPVWQGGALFLGSYDTTNQLATFSGNESLTAIFQTGEYEFNSGRRTSVSRIKIMTDAQGGVLARIGVRDSLSEPIKWTGFQSPSARSGDITTRANGRFITFHVVVENQFTNVQGIEILEMTEAGIR